ncbi:helix-turn-helix transcriptional regulator [Streptomyces spectabilis]|uniref:helix-turn-helix domain-containing protein n=1 Tax=Streptomyces spectabilis TaxID=68270 RepID=UPI0033D32871
MPIPFNTIALRTAAAAKGDNTTADIARRLGTPYGTVVRWTSGRGRPSSPAVAAMERTYGVTASELFPENA